ncbi:ion channel [Salicola sp. Rm-C-2C1-2]|uniref:ion channel n=1 Tax=Salicola sp. Rm-C-2C1-2 TaxID=3141321 RepID=UPI0032E484A3
MLTQTHAIILVATLVALIASVVIHCTVATALMRRFDGVTSKQSTSMVIMVLGLFVAHVVEIVLFGAISWLLSQLGGAGSLAGGPVSTIMDYIYFSTVTYTTLGYGEIYPVGAIRFIFGTEALIGFMLITWSASVTFLQMQRLWR